MTARATAYERGRAATGSERPTTENPYKARKQRDEWLRGHADGEDPEHAECRHRQAERAVQQGREPADVLAEFARHYPRYCSALTAEKLRAHSPPAVDLRKHGPLSRFACVRCGIDQRLVCCACPPYHGSDPVVSPWLRRVWSALYPRLDRTRLLGGPEEWFALRLLCTQGATVG